MEDTTNTAAAQTEQPTQLHETEVATKAAVDTTGTDAQAAGAAAEQAATDVAQANIGEAKNEAHGVLNEIEAAWKSLENVPADVEAWFKAKFNELRAKL